MAEQLLKQYPLSDYRFRSGHGGPRKGAGRKPTGRDCPSKKARPKFNKPRAVHVTLRIVGSVPCLRRPSFMKVIRASFRESCERGDFRLVQYSFQDGHVHLIVEADNQDALGRGMKSIGSRIARAAHRVFKITGQVISGPYHAHILKSPREVFRALRYVLLNARKHGFQRRGRRPLEVELDRASSARWFKGFNEELPADRTGPSEVSLARTWLLSTGWWQKHGLIDPAYVPGAR